MMLVSVICQFGFISKLGRGIGGVGGGGGVGGNRAKLLLKEKFD